MATLGCSGRQTPLFSSIGATGCKLISHVSHFHVQNDLQRKWNFERSVTVQWFPYHHGITTFGTLELALPGNARVLSQPLEDKPR